ncbi:hypothetical protein TSUD_136480 [Trifolium subterraneum]|uniref:Uncharacterized protein n=1 Tax=Trifolium subterraneum TaxID=3900 RepID=A0A2Z6P446_TRISU|nr:hypothetical protein TSUD_136480 [Trifolium subterraneum]
MGLFSRPNSLKLKLTREHCMKSLLTKAIFRTIPIQSLRPWMNNRDLSPKPSYRIEQSVLISIPCLKLLANNKLLLQSKEPNRRKRELADYETNVTIEIIGEIVFSNSEVDKKDATIIFAFNLLSLSYLEFAKLLCTTPISEVLSSPEKTVACTVVVAAPLPQHLFIFDPGVDECHVRSLAAICGNGVCVFDPGGDDHGFGSLVLILIKNHGTQSPLQVPWDRGKLGVSKSLFSVKHTFINCLFSFTLEAVSFPARGAASCLSWVSLKKKKRI